MATEGARKEIWASGLRNPHRLIWDVDPDNPANNHLIAAVIGLHLWETVDVVHKGANYGYPEREGIERLTADNSREKIPDDDKIAVQVTDTVTNGTVTPTYPVIAYPHAPGGGDAIAGGFVYRGRAMPALRGKYIFGDISTGRLWYADYAEMLAADDGNPKHSRRCTKCRFNGTAPQPMPRSSPIRRCFQSSRRRITRVAVRIPICRAERSCRARVGRAYGSQSMPPASCTFSARVTA